MRLFWTRVSIAAFLGVALLGCATPRIGDGGSRVDVYAEARYALESNEFDKAIALYEGLLAGGPGDEVSRAVQLEIGHAALRAGRPARAAAEAERFIARFPDSPMVGHAYVLAGVAAFENATKIRQARGNSPDYEHAYREAVSRLEFALAHYPDFAPGTSLSHMLLELQQYPP